MKKVLIGMVLASLAAPVMATVQAPLDERGNSLYTSDFVGVKPCTITASTGTTAVLCASGRGVAYGVVVTSIQVVTASEFAVFRDSGTGNTTSSSFTAVGTQPNGTTQVLPGSTVMQSFPRPIQFTNGLSVNLITAPQNNEIWTILYRPLAATE